MARSQDLHTSHPARPRLTRVPSAGAIRINISANDPAQPAVIGGAIAVELHGDLMTVMIDGAHGAQLLHLDAAALSLAEGLARIGAALAAASTQAAYPAPDHTSDAEVAVRQHRGYGS